MQPAASDLVDHRVHPFFQTSTVEALFAGKLEGELTFAELARHGDLGIGTLNAVDGEVIAVDVRFMRVDADSAISEVPPDARTPFAVERRVPPPSAALRIDGEFELVRARPVPRRRPPYRSIAEIAHEEHVFEFTGVVGTMVGFRFPDHTRGLEVRATTSTSSTPSESAAAMCWPAGRAASRCAWTRRPTFTWSPPGVEIGTTEPDEDEIRGVEG